MNDSHIVLHTLWRSRGTYFWSLLRNDVRNRVYYEPLNEGLATKTKQQWQLEFNIGVTNNLRHPKIRSHYISEYPNQSEGGLPRFSASMSYGRFFLTADGEDKELEAYLRWLVSYAEIFGQRACFKFVRGGLRAGFIRRVLGGKQIYVNRPSSEIHRSNCSFGPGSYFTCVLTYLLIRYADNPFCAATMESLRRYGPFNACRLGTRLGDDPSAAKPVSTALNIEQSATLTAAFWLAYLLEGLAIADFVIDTERLGSDEMYRSSIGAELVDSFGPGVITNYRDAPTPDDLTTCAQSLRNILTASERLRCLARAIPAPRFESLGQASRRLLDGVV